jgi:dTDP-glucose 4,6-dehydratase/UDP-glucose 4-epimerase
MFNIYGPRESASTLDEVLLYSLYVLREWEIPIFGQPKDQVRDYISVEDVARAFVLAAQSDGKGAFFYNICTGKGTSFAELLRIIEEETAIKSNIKILPLRPGELTKSWGVNDKAKEVIGFESQVNIEEGVREMISWIKSTPEEVLSIYRLD